MSSIFLQLLLNGIIAGAIYALVAAGFALICSVMKFMHFAHGGVVAAGAYFLYLFSLWFSPVLAVLFALIATILFGLLMDWSVYKQLRKRHASSAVLLIASIGLMILTSNIILIAFGADVKTIPLAQNNPVFDIFGARITLI
ncbi:MAG: branched-chain amino acid ABC transporter permease, partial [Candidatus Woesearchaeota archaeon]|nr:branched-chain amino acid ABC transporter permease [Candidatus Woesearchaeota archaeon]